MFALPWVKFAILGVLLFMIGLLYVQLQHEKEARAKDQTGWQTERANAAQAAASASEAYRAKEQAWAASAVEIQSEGDKRRAQLAADADRANRAAGSLRSSLDIAARALRSTASQTAPVASDCQAAAKTGDLLAELFRQADDRAGQLAVYADAAAAAGTACERSYEALNR